jgi:hydroxymethylpyrimidine pyrophosphatase-like HAD family hydrolase
MAYRLLALDLDGTLLRSDHTVDPRDVAAIAELQAAGVVVTIVTGRLHSGAVAAARACAIDGVIACMEGSHLIDLATGATVAHHPLADAATARWRAAVDAHDLAGFVLDADGIHHDHRGAAYAGYVATWSPNLRVVDADGVAGARRAGDRRDRRSRRGGRRPRRADRPPPSRPTRCSSPWARTPASTRS